MNAADFNALQYKLHDAIVSLDPSTHSFDSYYIKFNGGHLLLMCTMCDSYFMHRYTANIYNGGRGSRRPVFLSTHTPSPSTHMSCYSCRLSSDIAYRTRQIERLEQKKVAADKAKKQKLDRFWNKGKK